MAAKTFDQCLLEVKSRSWCGPDSTNLADWSPAAIDMLLQLIEAGKPVVKAKLYERQLKAGAKALERLNASLAEVKAIQMRELRDPYLSWLQSARSGPLNWQ